MVATPEYGVGARLVRRGSPIRTPWRSLSPETVKTSPDSKRPHDDSGRGLQDQPPVKKALFTDDIVRDGDDVDSNVEMQVPGDDEVDTGVTQPQFAKPLFREMDASSEPGIFTPSPIEPAKQTPAEAEGMDPTEKLASSMPEKIMPVTGDASMRTSSPLDKSKDGQVIPGPDRDIPHQLITDKGPAYVLRPAGSSSIIGEPGQAGSAPGGGSDTFVISDNVPYQKPTVLQRVPITEEIAPMTVCDPKTGNLMEAIPTDSVEDLENSLIAFLVNPDTLEMEILDPEHKIAVKAKPEDGSQEAGSLPGTTDQVRQRSAPASKDIPLSKSTSTERPLVSQGFVEQKPKVKAGDQPLPGGQHQVLTSKGPAYEVRPVASESVPPDANIFGVAPSEITDDESMSGESIPRVIGSTPVNLDKVPINFINPATGQLMEAVPLVDPGDVNHKTTAYVADPELQTLEIISPHLRKPHDGDIVNIST